jgi:hypothetical protein
MLSGLRNCSRVKVLKEQKQIESKAPFVLMENIFHSAKSGKLFQQKTFFDFWLVRKIVTADNGYSLREKEV